MLKESKPVATLTDDGKKVNFTVDIRGARITCAISREALETWFWLTPAAGPDKVLKAYIDGASRISAVATRKALRSGKPAQVVILEARDFESA
ncbi:hypothetical protein WQE_18669 [Paraburkholderia hospita]|uniref:DUF1488 domain-containing protein n=1 Tax=Paraburkholderia hospita TaxID=169430 RepID=A0ABN0FLA6_9BURK|nr:DUF1488 family protein [Paraburkholderia hospita]EIM99504.1 hypothetical protein WQE_18669 [Paraburkholderia hospita]OUL70254.1 hypothetical protein CA602_48295 [Paraburkholderia hospita]